MSDATLPRGSLLGTRVHRLEDPELLTTGATYTDDVVDDRLTGALRATFVRSPLAHARITELDTAAALAAPGCVAVLTAADLDDVPPPAPAFSFLPGAMGLPLLASGTVRYVGEPVAVVLTEDGYAGEDVAELVDVEYDALPAVVDPLRALDDALLLFPEAGTNVAFARAGTAGEELFEGCEVVVTERVLNQRVAVAPLEVRAAAAVWEADERLTMWVPNQGAQNTRSTLGRMLGLPAPQVHVVTPAVGGAFGAKFGADPEAAVVGWAARRLGRPVRWVETRSENLMGMTHGRGQVQTVTIGGDRDGRVRAYRLDIVQDCGAYPRIGALLPTLTQLMAPGVYDIERIASSFRSVVTTTTPVGAYRGAGRPEATAAIERAMDLFAAEVGRDPADVRRRNLLARFTEPQRSKGGALYDSGDYPMALEKVLEAAGYGRLRPAPARAGRAARPPRHPPARPRPVDLRRDHRRRRRGRVAARERHRGGAP